LVQNPSKHKAISKTCLQKQWCSQVSANTHNTWRRKDSVFQKQITLQQASVVYRGSPKLIEGFRSANLNKSLILHMSLITKGIYYFVILCPSMVSYMQ